jgi:cysteine desulfurase
MLDLTHYFDHSATTPPRAEVVEAMQAAMLSDWGNPSSQHRWGQQAALAMETARQQVAGALGVDPETIVFTSGGTEANNLALTGICNRYPSPRHLIISSVEHSSVENTAQHLQTRGWRITRLPVTSEGLVSVTDLEQAIQPDTVLISLLHGQNEVGAIQPIQELTACCRAANIPFHTDAVQTAGRLPLQPMDLGVDLLSISAHKLYGPKGIGLLYVRPGLPLSPLLHGGGQESKLRSGTQPLAAIVGFGAAAELAQGEQIQETPRLRQLQNRLYQHLQQIPTLTLTGPQSLSDRLPHHLSYVVQGITGPNLVRQLDRAGFGISAGSACQRGQLRPSRVLLAMGYPPELTLGAIRISLGKSNTLAAVDALAAEMQTLLMTPASLAGVV